MFESDQSVDRKASLERAIAKYRQALDLRPVGHPRRHASLNNLGMALYSHHIHFDDSNKKSLDDAIDMLYEAYDIRREIRSPELSSTHNNLCGALEARFQLTMIEMDLSTAINHAKEAFDPADIDHSSYMSRAGNLARLYITRHRCWDSSEDDEGSGLSNADLLQATEILEALPPISYDMCDPSRIRLDNHLLLMDCYYERFRLHCQTEADSARADLERALEGCQLASEVAAKNGWPSPWDDNSLFACALLGRYMLQRHSENGVALDSSDFDRALELFNRQAKAARGPLQSNRAVQAQTQVALALLHGDGDRLKSEAADLLKTASLDYPTASPFCIITAALHWSALCDSINDPSAVEAYSRVFQAVGKCILTTHNIENQHIFLSSCPKDLVSYAAACAVRYGQPERAVEFLEEGRDILFGQIRRLKADLSALDDEDLKKDYSSITSKIMSKTTRLKSTLTTSSPSISLTLSPLDNIIRHNTVLDAEDREYVGLISSLNDVFSRIRAKAGFEHFPFSSKFPDLQLAAAHGPVIILIASTDKGYALIIQASGPPTVVDLPECTFERVSSLSQTFRDKITSSPATASEDSMKDVLRELDRILGQAVCERLKEMGVAPKSRIWLSPAGDLSRLPLHATPKLRQTYISSYAPTLSGLIHARQNRAPAPGRDHQSLLLIAEPGGDDGQPLELNGEIDGILEQFGKEDVKISVTTLCREEATKEAVLTQLRKHSMIHFTGHGRLHIQPLQSSFELHNQVSLTSLDLLELKEPLDIDLAFLSICSGASRNAKAEIYPSRTGAQNEAINLAGCLHLCGVRNVVGTMYEMFDQFGPSITQLYYKKFLEDGEEPAVALWSAVRAIARKQRQNDSEDDSEFVPSIIDWVNFIHVGI
jgi:CHAT domain-containing protein